MIIDVHAHIGLSQDGGHGKLDELLENMKLYGISKTILFATDEDGRGDNFEAQNDKIIAAANNHPDKIIAFVRLNPATGKRAIAEFKRCVKNGVKGLKLKCADGFDPKDSRPIFDLMAEMKNFPVLMHTDHKEHSQPRIWEPLVKKYPSINFILAHGGKDHYQKCTEIAIKYPNAYVDTSTLSYNRTRYIYENAGAEKLLFASDYPYSHQLVELKKFEVLIKNKEALDLIFTKNAQKLLGL